VLTGSGVDEAWATGVMLGRSVIKLLKTGKPFTKENLEATYVARRRQSWVEEEGLVAQKARNGFQKGVVPGLLGMALAGLTKGKLAWPGRIRRTWERIPSIEEYFRGKISARELELLRQECTAKGDSLHDALMDKAGWPAIPYDGKLLLSHQDALLLGGKVQAPAGYKDHVAFVDRGTCERCTVKTCIEACSGQAITTNPEGGVPLFDREKCVHCGACLWNCSRPNPRDLERTNIEFQAGAGGLHSAEN
jgi:electron-transferring-flavoprotein dehydrogenase